MFCTAGIAVVPAPRCWGGGGLKLKVLRAKISGSSEPVGHTQIHFNAYLWMKLTENQRTMKRISEKKKNYYSQTRSVVRSGYNWSTKPSNLANQKLSLSLFVDREFGRNVCVYLLPAHSPSFLVEILATVQKPRSPGEDPMSAFRHSDSRTSLCFKICF